MTNELGRIWKGGVVAQSNYYPRMWQKVLRRNKKNLSEDSRHPGPDSNHESPISGSSHVGFVVDKVALGQFFSE
jgi:hypothetical protein